MGVNFIKDIKYLPHLGNMVVKHLKMYEMHFWNLLHVFLCTGHINVNVLLEYAIMVSLAFSHNVSAI